MGFVIGKKGSSIKEIEMVSGAKLNSDSDRRGFLVSGNKDQRARARELVQQKVVSSGDHIVPRISLLCFKGSRRERARERVCSGECQTVVPQVFVPYWANSRKQANLESSVTGTILIGFKND